MTCNEFTVYFQVPLVAARIIRAAELGMRLPPGLFSREDLLDTVKERRDQLFADILADTIMQPILRADAERTAAKLRAAQDQLDQQRREVAIANRILLEEGLLKGFVR